MRSNFVNTILELMERNDKIFFLTGDLGYGVLEPVKEKFPKNFYNVGVAEQNMIGLAAGLAMSNKIPIAYSIATFASLRPFEFIRNDVCYQNLNVKIVGVGAGLSYPQYAATHQAIDDVAVMRSLPNLVILNPGDPIEVRLATKAMLEYNGPVYLRIGKRGEPNVHKSNPDFRIGKAITLKEGKDISVVATGNILDNTSKAVEILEKDGMSINFISLPTIKPLDVDAIQRAVKSTGIIVTVEENFTVGGIGTAVADALAELGVTSKIHKIGLPQKYLPEIGSQDYMRDIYGLTPSKIANQIKKYVA